MTGNPNPIQTPEFIKAQWKKGQSGNPKGKPKGTEDTAKMIARILNKIIKLKDHETGEYKEITGKEALILKQFELAIKGNQQAFDRLFDRLEGKPKQIVDQTNINKNYTFTSDLDVDPDND